jgi:hypothetical protein
MLKRPRKRRRRQNAMHETQRLKLHEGRCPCQLQHPHQYLQYLRPHQLLLHPQWPRLHRPLLHQNQLHLRLLLRLLR